MSDPTHLICSMCGKPGHSVRKLIAGVAGNICEECVGICATIILAADNKREEKRAADIERALADREKPIPFEGIR